ncbi:MAG: PAS domain-containing protein [Chloroflexi bacterium]|nr:PAS domain-containing protein [Chloroflexota bacterium]
MLLARLGEDAAGAGLVPVQVSANPAGRFDGLKQLKFDDIAPTYPSQLHPDASPGNIALIAESPSSEQDHFLHELALTAGIFPVSIYRQDQITTRRLLQLIAEHRYVLSVDGWKDQLAEGADSQGEIPEFLNGPARFRLVTNSIPFLLAYLDRDITYRFINEPFCQWFGLPRSAILGAPMRALVGEEAYELARPHIQKALAGEKTSLTNRFRHADGSVHIARSTYIPDRQPDGQVRGFISSIDDITYQEEVKDRLRQSEHRLRAIIANIPIVLFTLDSNGIFTLSEGKGLQTLGLTPGQVVGQSVDDVYRGNTPLLQCIHRALAGESFQELVSDLNGHSFETWYSPLLDGDGQVQGVLGISADVTERVEAVNALRMSEERYRSLVENQGEGVMMVDADLRIEYLNLAAEGVLRRPVNALIGTNLDDLFAARQRRVLHAQFDKRKKGNRSTYEISYRDPAGVMHQLLITATPRFDSTGKFVGSFVVIRDITDRKIVEEDLRYRSTHDALTGLHNRFFFDEELSRLEENHRQPISVLMLDMDGLKKINDSFGHFAGDEALRRVARLVRSCLRGEDLVARLGGDEFAVLLPNTRQRERDRIIARMNRMLSHSNRQNPGLPLAISIGAATAQPGESLRRALEEADQRLYEEKRRKKEATPKTATDPGQ